MGMILRIASSRIVGQGDIVGRSGYFSLNLSANSVMRGRLDARRTLKSLVADLRLIKNPLAGILLYSNQPTDKVIFQIYILFNGYSVQFKFSQSELPPSTCISGTFTIPSLYYTYKLNRGITMAS